jgi:hypothetical protein
MDLLQDITLETFINTILGPSGLNILNKEGQIKQILTDKNINLGQVIDKKIIDKVQLLLAADNEINDFENRYNIKNKETKRLLGNLKFSLAKLQTLSLIKKIEKSEDCSGVLNSLIGALNQKIEGVNNILLDQKGGGKEDNKFINKYYKYKVKYLNLKYKFL